MKKQDTIALAIVVLCIALAVFLLSIGVPENRPDFTRCPLCNQPAQ